MSTVIINEFSGILPKVSATLLQDNQATEARNLKLQSGEIRSYNRPKAVQKVEQEGVQSIFKLEGSSGASQWLEWTVDTDVCYSPIADNDEFRIYYSEGGVCKKTNYSMATQGTGPAPRNWLYLGVPYPTVAPALKANRVPNNKDEWEKEHPDKEYEEFSADNTSNRAYVYTYVSTFGQVEEESAPSDATQVVCDTEGGSVEVSGFADPPTDHLNITKIRIYRTVSGSSSTIYQLVDELSLTDHKLAATGVSLYGVPWSDRTYVDKRSASQLGKELDSLNYTPPPEGLKGLVSMPNGFLAGFVHNQVWFSEPYLPHAWPSSYMLTTDSPIVGLGVYGSTLVVATSRQPYTISGTSPASMTQEKQPMSQPCVSKRSIAYDQYGVLYASAYGVVALAAGQMDVFTRPIVSQDEWKAYNPSTMLAVMYNNQYIAVYRKGNETSMLIFARGETPELVNYDFTPVAMHIERGSGRLFCLSESDNYIYEIDADDINKEQFTWQSKRFVNPYLTSFSCMKLDADYDSNTDVVAWEAKRKEIDDYNAAIWAEREGKSLLGEFNAVTLNTFEVNGGLLKPNLTKAEFRSVTVTIYADGHEVYSKVFTSLKACRIPPYKGYAWWVKFVGNVDIRSFSMSTSMRELASPQ